MNKRIYRMLASLSCVATVAAAQAKDLSIYISADMEGIAGVVSEQQLDILQISKFLVFALEYQSDLAP